MNTHEPLYKNVLDTRTGQLKRVDVNDPGVRESIMKRELIPFEENMPAPRMEDIGYYDQDIDNMQIPDESFGIPDGFEGPISSEPNMSDKPGRAGLIEGTRLKEVELPARILRGQDPNDYMVMPPSQINNQADMYEVAEGGIIGLGHGGMSNPMDMQAMDGMMFKDPEDGEEWEYNV